MSLRRAAKRASKPKLSVNDFEIPKSFEELDDQVGSAKVPDIDKLDNKYFASGSEVTQIQFLALRIIFPRLTEVTYLTEEAVRVDHGLEKSAWDEAVILVNGCPEFRNYFRIVELDTPIDGVAKSSLQWPGSLKPIRKVQEQVGTVNGVHDRDRKSGVKSRNLTGQLDEAKHAPAATEPEASSRAKGSKADKLPEADDEVTSNTAIVLLLQAILDLVPGTAMEWQLNHLQLQAVFKNGKYAAFTDGGLLSKPGQTIHAIVEAKKRARASKTETIQMQEGAEMVGLIRSEKGRMPLKDHHIVVSQDRDEVYVTFASWHPEYLAYLKGGPVTENSHLEMRTVGPWMTGEALHMKQLAIVITAIILIAKNIDTQVDA